MTAVAAAGGYDRHTPEMLSRLLGKRLPILIFGHGQFLHPKTGRAQVGTRALAAACGAKSKTTILRANPHFAAVLEIEPAAIDDEPQGYRVKREWRSAFNALRDTMNPDFRRRWRGGVDTNVSESITPLYSESLNPCNSRAREGFSQNQGVDTTGIDDGASLEAERPPSGAVGGIEGVCITQTPSVPSDGDRLAAAEGIVETATPSPAAEGVRDPRIPSEPAAEGASDLPAPSACDLHAVEPGEPAARSLTIGIPIVKPARPFVPIGGRCQRKPLVPPAERARRFELLRWQKIPRQLRKLIGPQAAKAYLDGQLMAASEPEALAEVDRLATRLAAVKYDLDDEPLRDWKIRQGLPVKPLPPERETPASALASTEPPRSRADLYREAYAHVPMPGWYHGSARRDLPE